MSNTAPPPRLPEALQEAVFKSGTFSIIATDAKGVIQLFNVEAESPAELSDAQELAARARLLTTELGTAIAPDFQALACRASRGIEDIYELTYVRKDGTRLPAEVSVSALRDAEGEIIGYLLIGTDNTARHQAPRAAGAN